MFMGIVMLKGLSLLGGQNNGQVRRMYMHLGNTWKLNYTN